MKTKLPLIAAVLAVLLLGGFGVSRLVSSGSSHNKLASNQASTDPQSSSSNGASSQSSSAKSGASKPTRYHKPCTPRVLYSKLAGEPSSAQFIRAQPVFQSEWGPHCQFLHPGMHCRVGWNAGYSVPNGDAYLMYQEWAEGSKHVTSQVEIGPVPGNNQIIDQGVWFAIPNANSVAFRLVLENDKRIPVAVSDSYIYPIDCAPLSR
ncbi:MAG: hypothetical protein ACYDCC_01805 [Actinomycetota bacterium]